MMTICFGIAGLGFFVQSFMVPENGNTFFGYKVYAQQVLSLITFLGIVVVVIYMNKIILKLKRIEKKNG